MRERTALGDTIVVKGLTYCGQSKRESEKTVQMTDVMEESVAKEGPMRRRKESNRKESCYRDDARRANGQGSEFAGWY